MTKPTVTLTPEQAALADQLVAEHLFKDREAVLEAAFAKLRQAKARYDAELPGFMKHLQEGVDDAAAGRFFDGTVEDIIAQERTKRRR